MAGAWIFQANPNIYALKTALVSGQLNEEIRQDKVNLGPGFEIGHSFFCPQGTEEELGYSWYESVIRAEIAPLIREYWFDDAEKAQKIIDQLLR